MATRLQKRTIAGRQTALTPRAPWYDRDGVLLLLLAVVAFAVFAPACIGDFVFWDDNLNVSKNPWLNPPTFATIVHFWKHPFLDLYIPLTYTVWTALAAVAQMPTPDSSGIRLNPFVFHTANLLVHICAVAITYALLRRLVGRKWPAAAGALLFALHPLQVEPVAWVTGMKDVLCGALALAALWQYVSFAQADPANASRRWSHYVATIVLFLLAILAKPLAVVVPALALILDLLVLHTPWRRAFARLLPMAALAAVGAFASVKFQTVAAPADAGHYLLRPLIATDALAFYAYKLVLPIWLGFHYDRAPLTVIHAGWLYYTWLVPAAMVLASVLMRKRFPWLLPAVALFVVGVAPVLGLVPFSFQRYATVADRYVYLAMLGPAFALAAALAAWDARRPRSQASKPNIPRGAIISLVALFSLLGVRAFIQTFTWRDNAALFANAVAVNPRSSAAYDGMAGELASQKRPDDSPETVMERLMRAREYAQHATALSHDSPDGYITLGSIYNMMQDLPDATEAFRKAVDIAPEKAEALNSLGGALAAQGRRDEAEVYLLRAIARNPELAQAHLNLGMLRTQQHRLDDALRETRLAVRLDGGNPQARINYAMLLYFHGETQAARQQLDAARQIDGTLPNLQNAYRMIERPRRP